MFHILIQGIKHWYVLDVRSWTDEDVQQPCLYEPLSIQVSILNKTAILLCIAVPATEPWKTSHTRTKNNKITPMK